MLLFLDSNVLFSAVRNPEGRAAVFFEFAGRGLYSLISSPHAIEEARRNIQIKHPDLIPNFSKHLGIIHLCREGSAETVAWAQALGLPLKDAPILAAAVEAQADLLITGDRAHFGALYGKRIRGAEIVTPATALARILKLLA